MANDEDEAEVPVFKDGAGFNGDLEDVELMAIEGAELENLIVGFEPEPAIDDNIIPHSDSEKEDDNEDDVAVMCRSLGVSADGSENELFVGQCFFSKAVLEQAVLQHALNDGRNVKKYRYDRNKIGYICDGKNCEWKLYCGRLPDDFRWELRVLNNVHTCVRNGDCHLLKVPVIARMFIDRIREFPDKFLPMKMQELIMEKFRIRVTRGQCQVARKKALKWIENEYDRQFQRIRDYVSEILVTNPGSTAIVETSRSFEGVEYFNRFYACFEALKRSWKDSCRKVIGLDGCHLKGSMKGVLLIVIGRDGDNSIYPIAWGVVQVEDTPNWLWFLRKLKDDLDLGVGKDFVLMSDRQKGLINAVELEFPEIEHRMCVRHLYNNMKSKHKKKDEMKLLMYKLSWSYNELEYKRNLDSFLEYDIQVYADVLKTNPETWCRLYYKIGSCCEDTQNNFTKSFNATAVRARHMALVPMLELLAREAMVRIHKRSIIAAEHTGRCTPYAKSELTKEYHNTSALRVYSGTNGMHDVVEEGWSFQVSLKFRKCSCLKWQIRGIPYQHAYAVMMHKKLEPGDYVAHWFLTSTWRRTYTDALVPTRGAPLWPMEPDGPVYRPPSPPQQGRPKKKRSRKKDKRIKGKNESPTKKATLKKRIMHCGVCGAANHNSRYHSKKGQSSQVVPSQGETSEVEASQGAIIPVPSQG